jgi:hypothetical protein
VASLYRGHEVAVHTVTHPHLDRIPPQAVLTEIIEDRRALEQLVGYPVTGMALPFGTYTDRVLEIAAAAGIRYCRPVATRRDFAPPGDPLRWQPTTHHKGDLLELWTAFTESTREDKLFFWWGHSYEFAGDDNWELLEEFGTAVTGISNLWHATNMEIIEYLEAYRNLEFAVELSSLRNRSGIPVWLRINNELQRITPGTTLQLAGPETLE